MRTKRGGFSSMARPLIFPMPNKPIALCAAFHRAMRCSKDATLYAELVARRMLSKGYK